MNKKDDLLNLIEELDRYLYTKNDVLDDVKWDKHDLLNHADTILKKYDLCYGSTSFHLNVNDNTFSESPYIMDLNTGKIIAQYERNADTYDRLCNTDESKMKLVALHKLLTNYMDYFYENVEEFNIHSIIGGILDTLNNYNNCNIKDKQFVINDFNRYKTICDEEGIYITYSISHFDATHITICAEYSQNGYVLRSNVKKIKLGGEYIPHNIAWAKLHCLREVLLLLTYNVLK